MPKKKTTIIVEELTDEEVAAEQQGEPVTLADMPEGVACVVDNEGTMYVRLRLGEAVHWVANDGRAKACAAMGPRLYRVIARLDGLPLPVKTKPLPKTLEDCLAVTERAVVYKTTYGRRCRIDDQIWAITGDGLGAYLVGRAYSRTSPHEIGMPTNLRLTVKTEGGE